MNSATEEAGKDFAKQLLKNKSYIFDDDFNPKNERASIRHEAIIHAFNILTFYYAVKDLKDFKAAKKAIHNFYEAYQRSLEDPFYFEVMSYLSALMLQARRDRKRLPFIVHKWVGSFLKGEIARPPTPLRQRRRRTNQEMYYDLIIDTVESVCLKFGVAVHSEYSPKWTGCEAVAKALTELKLAPTTAHEVFRKCEENGGIHIDLAADKQSKIENGLPSEEVIFDYHSAVRWRNLQKRS